MGGARPLVPQDGVNLLPTLRAGRATGRRYVLERWGGGGTTSTSNPEGFQAYRTSQWLYVRLTSGEYKLYNERADPFELTNIAGQPATERTLDRALTAASAREPPPKAAPKTRPQTMSRTPCF